MDCKKLNKVIKQIYSQGNEHYERPELTDYLKEELSKEVYLFLEQFNNLKLHEGDNRQANKILNTLVYRIAEKVQIYIGSLVQDGIFQSSQTFFGPVDIK